MSSFASLAVAIVPWLLVGGTLVLHHPFDPAAFLAQRQGVGPDTIVVPGPLVAQFAESGHLAPRGSRLDVIAVWRTPELAAHAPAWRDTSTRLIDIHAFGEIGLIAACRGQGGKPAAVPFGVVFAPRGVKGAVAAIEITSTPAGTVALRGPMVPPAAFPPGAERGGPPYFKVAASGFVDTGYTCLPDSPAMVVTGPPSGIVSIGGYRFVLRDLQEAVSRLEQGEGALAVLPDALAGHRLTGNAADPTAVYDALVQLGANPLLAGAFRERPRPAA
jgi:hypothetical protein